MKALIAGLMQANRARQFRAFAGACRDPEGAQHRVLTSLVARAEGTAYAARVGVNAAKIRNVDDLRARVALCTYDDLSKEITASLEGAPNQLIPGRPDFFAVTSGTSGRSKHIPIDATYRRAFQAPMQHYLYGIVRDHPRAFADKVLYMVGPPELETSAGGATIGTISGYNYRNLSPLLKRFAAVPWPVFSIRDPHAQTYAVACLAARHSVSFAVAITTAPLAAVGCAMRDHAESILRDLHDGTLSTPTGHLSASEAASLAPYLRRERSRSRELAAAAGRSGSLTPRVVWPKLALLSCWAHAGAASHRHLLPELFGVMPIRSAVYSATEGWINVPLRDDDPSGVLAIESGLYEFETLAMDGAPTGDTLLPHEVRVGDDYGIVLSSGCGLFRYRLGDRVRITGTFERTPELRFVSKLGAVLSLAHDLTSDEHVRTAIDALVEMGVMARGQRWAFGPSTGFPPRYRLVVQRASHGDAPIEWLATDFDRALGRANLGYEADREAAILEPTEVVAISARAFDAWDAERRRGVGNQAKPADFVMTAAELPTESECVGAR